MVKTCAALLLTVALPSALGAAWNVCVQDSDALLSAPVRAAALREFSELMGAQRASLDFGDCTAEGRRIQLEVLAEAPEHLHNVLGQAYRRHERIEPLLNVYYESLVRYLGHPNNAYAIGRAVARVAAHEVQALSRPRPVPLLARSVTVGIRCVGADGVRLQAVSERRRLPENRIGPFPATSGSGRTRG